MLPLPRLPAVAALDSALFIGTSWTDLTDGGATTLHKHDHGGQDGLTDDDHAGYFRNAGRAGGQIGIGGTAVGDALVLKGTSANGTSTVEAIKLMVGNDGGTYGLSILNSGECGLGCAPVSSVGLALGGTVTSVDHTFGLHVQYLTLTPANGYNAFFFSFGGRVDTGAANTIPLVAGVYSGIFTKVGSGTITDTYGLYIPLSTAGTNNYGGFIEGKLGLGIEPPVEMLDVLGNLALKYTAAPAAVAADTAVLYTKDAGAAAGYSWFHVMGEQDVEHILIGAIYKTDAGDPAVSHTGAMLINIADNAVKIVREGAWRQFVFVDDTNWADLTDAGNTTLHKHDIYILADGTRAFTGSQSFAGYKAVAMACDNGTSFPTSPAPTTGQWFYRSDIDTLFFYEGAWKPIISFASVAMYVSKSGTDGAAYGYSSGAGAFLTLAYAVSMIPAIIGGSLTIYVGAGTYNENVVIEGKVANGPYSIMLQGELNEDDSGTIDSGVQGGGATQGTITDTGNLSTGHASKLLLATLDSVENWKIIDTCTADTATICGSFDRAPDNNDTYKVYSWLSIITGSGYGLTVRNQLVPVVLYRMDVQDIYCTNRGTVSMLHSRSDKALTQVDGSFSANYSVVESANNPTVEGQVHSYIGIYSSKVRSTAASAWVVRLNGATKGVIANGSVIAGNAVGSRSSFGVLCDMNSMLECYTTDYVVFRSDEWGVYSLSGSMAFGCNTSYCTFTDVGANVVADASTYGVAG